MSTFRKAGILLVVLAIPALSYLFLKGFGRNHYTLPRFIPIIDSTTGNPLIKDQLNTKGQLVSDTLFRTVPGFQLIDQNGRSIDGTLTKGKIHIAAFFFTRCSTICPKISSELTRVQDVFIQQPSVIIVSFSVDPVHDQPVQLRKYAQQYDAKPGRWYFLTGDKAQIYRLAQRGYFLPVVDHGVSYGSPDETFIHSEKLILVDKEGYIRGFYDGTDKKDVDRLILETRVLLNIYANS